MAGQPYAPCFDGLSMTPFFYNSQPKPVGKTKHRLLQLAAPILIPETDIYPPFTLWYNKTGTNRQCRQMPLGMVQLECIAALAFKIKVGGRIIFYPCFKRYKHIRAR